ncbi:hypothetical protein AXF42_Ash021516 [Apostasia shenzhenica]|uniref:UDP-N-acetylmuramoyl-L-alanyl-D-glutamate--2,6-diaminopimelate ligase n=1 Tax=Apostasia shenzhenica TaxID=1088818 RepID=A0A2H9ZVQ0_9ASPA|nr:hypothetical protein AXF42_Ash021516 [Apostasia shenzhenica]
MALSAFSLIPLSKPTSIPLLSFRRPIPIHAAARELREGLATEKLDSDNPAGMHRAITLKSLEERQPERVRIAENGFRMALGDLLKQSRVLPLCIFGDLAVEITGIENDSRKVSPGDLFVCCTGYKTDGHLFINDAITRGAVVVIASRNIELDGILGCGALVIVEEVNSFLPHLAANFYGNPSERTTVIGVTGTNGKTTTAHLVRGIYVAMGVKTGMLGTVGYHAHEEIQLEVPNTTPDAVTVQKLMAKMVRNGTEAVVMEASSHGLALGRCDAIDFDVAVFTNLTRDHYDFHVTEEDYRNSKAKLFSGMVDPNCHCKVVNIDDPNAYFFAAQGNENVPVVTYAMENGDADVFPLNVELSLRKTAVSVKTPKGNLQISTCLIGRHNVYNILAAVAVGIGISAMLEEIKEGIERVEAVSGRFELINENQPFGVIVDFAHTPDALSRLLDAVRELGALRIITGMLHFFPSFMQIIVLHSFPSLINWTYTIFY